MVYPSRNRSWALLNDFSVTWVCYRFHEKFKAHGNHCSGCLSGGCDACHPWSKLMSFQVEAVEGQGTLSIIGPALQNGSRALLILLHFAWTPFMQIAIGLQKGHLLHRYWCATVLGSSTALALPQPPPPFPGRVSHLRASPAGLCSGAMGNSVQMARAPDAGALQVARLSLFEATLFWTVFSETKGRRSPCCGFTCFDRPKSGRRKAVLTSCWIGCAHFSRAANFWQARYS